MTPTPPPAHPDRRPTEAQPRWRRDFPIETEEDQFVSRRDFAKFLVLTSGAMVAGQAFLVAKSGQRRANDAPASRAIAREADVAPGEALPFWYPDEGEPCLLVRLPDGGLVAFAQKCTHLSCAVVPEVEAGRFTCPCHRGAFDLRSGRPVEGPPRRPLPKIRIEVRGRDDLGLGRGTQDMSADRPSRTRPQRLVIVYGMTSFILALFLCQLWLITATVNAFLGGDDSVVRPAAVASLLCLVLNLGLFRYLSTIERT